MHKEQVTLKELGGVERLVFDEKDIKKVEKLAATHTVAQLADYLCVGQNTFYQIMKRQPEVAVGYKKGKAVALEKIADSLMDHALGTKEGGNMTAAIFYLKTQARWSEAVPEVKVEEQIAETFEEKATRMKKIKEYTEYLNDDEWHAKKRNNLQVKTNE